MANKRGPNYRCVKYSGKSWHLNQHGYYYNGNLKIGLHKYIWEEAYGPVPVGYVIHHKDEDKLNNDLDNLECLTDREHRDLHGKSPITRYKMGSGMRGNYHSNAARSKMSRAALGRKRSKESVEASGKGHYKAILCLETGEAYDSATTASKLLGISRDSLYGALGGRQKSAGGYHWAYVPQETA